MAEKTDPKATVESAPVTNVSAEMALLGCMIYDNSTIGDILEVVESGEAFSVPANRTVFETAVAMYNERKIVDLVTLKTELAREGKLSAIGGTPQAASAHLAEYVVHLPSPDAALQYAAAVRDAHILRTIMGACSNVVHLILEGERDPETVRNDAEKALFTALARSEKRKAQTMVEILHEVFGQIQDIHNRKARILGLPTGYYELDDMISGLQKGHLYIMAGRPSMGKTSLAMNIIENVALREQKPALFFSLEMSSSQVGQTMLCSHARVDSRLLRSGRISEEEFQKLILAAGAFNESKIVVDDSSDLTALELRTRARRWKAREDVSLVVVDYLQKMSGREGSRYEGRQVEISNISGHLKSMAKELNVPVIAVAQLNRSPESREDRKPQLSDLRESGAIEQDADVVMLLYREEYYNRETEKKGIAEVSVAKNRTGPVGTVELAFLNKFTRFENLAVRPS